jgi:uncharacterized protein (DUF433 family)
MGAITIIDRGRGPELAGTRITVFDVIHYHQAGHSPTYIASILGLSTAEVLALLEYVEQHKDEVMEMNRKIEERIARGNPPEVEKRLEGSPSHARIQARWEELQRQRSQGGDNGAGHRG